ncbi:MAG: R3H domain-containing nucleic acid-binding protein [Acidimicrobiales bacterium]|nr:R3H domain-containing nucleic acid-binding protein [Acidimicrobiales bacterium]
MEWVEVRGEDVAAAEELALDQLGVAREDAEFEVVTAPENRWLGLKKTEARVRARVKPVGPRPKTANQQQKNRRNKKNSRQKTQTANKNNKSQKNPEKQGENKNKKDEPSKKPPVKKKDKAAKMEKRETMPQQEQEKAVIVFLEGIIAAFGMDATASIRLEDERIIGSIDGDDIGTLIGPKAGTLLSLQDLARTTVQRHAAGRQTSRLSIDVGGYRERRKASLIEFTLRQIEDVNESGEAISLEPMGSADRKIIHDAVAERNDVTSSSEGDEPRRYVVIHPSETE